MDSPAPCFLDAWRRDERRPLVQRSVRLVLVVVEGVGRDNVVEVAAANDQQLVEAFPAQAADPAFGVRSHQRGCTGPLITRILSERTTSSKLRVNLLSRSRMRNRGRTSSSSSPISRLRPCWVTHGPSGLVVIPASQTRRVANSM
jgi:hypothetical protein